MQARLALAGEVTAGHDLAEAAQDAGCPAVVPVGGVFRRGSFGEVGAAPELVEPGQFPEGFGVAGPAGPDLLGQVAGVLGAQDGLDPVGQLAKLVLASLVVQGEPEPSGRRALVLFGEQGEDPLDLALQLGDAIEGGGVLVLGACDLICPRGERFDVMPEHGDLDRQGGGRSRTATARRRLTAACQSLWALNSAVQTAHRQTPVSPAGRELLCAIPVNSLPPRRLPDGTESVAALCDGAITTAERVRQLAWGLAARAAWSPEVSVASLHQVAAASTVTSHNCSVVLQTLTTGTADRGSDRLQADLAEAAEAANHARQAWRRVAGALDHVVTDGRGHLSPSAVETRDLAIWTGRLAYAEPEWTPSSGPRQEIRPPESLMPAPQHVPLVVAAVHHACHTLTRLAWAQEGVIRTAAQAGRILVPARSLPDDLDIPHPYTQAPREHIDRLLSGYRIAGHASHWATIAVARVAQASGAPSRALASAMATEPGRDHDETGRRAMNSQTRASLKQGTLDSVGPVERTLLDLGVTRPDLLRRAADLDHDSERLIVDAAVDRELVSRSGDA